MKESLSKGEDSEGDILGIYSNLTQIIASSPELYGVSNPIAPKVAGEPYNLQWAGNLFNSIKSRYNKITEYEINAESEFLDGRDKNKIINLQTVQKEEVERFINEIYNQFVSTLS